MDQHKSNDIDRAYNEKKKEMKEKSFEAKKKVFNYIQALREIKRNLLYFREYFTDREKFASEQKNYPELAFLWSVHKEVIQEYLNYMEEMRKEDLSKMSNEVEITMPNVIITNETFGFNKTKVQTEISNKRNMTKNDGFEQKQKDENYSIIEKTRNLILDLRKRKKENMMKADKKKEALLNQNDENNADNNDIDNEADTTVHTAIDNIK